MKDDWVLYTKSNNKWVNTKWAPKPDEKIKAHALRIERMSYEIMPNMELRKRELFLKEKFLPFLPLDVQKKIKNSGYRTWSGVVDRASCILDSSFNQID